MLHVEPFVFEVLVHRTCFGSDGHHAAAEPEPAGTQQCRDGYTRKSSHDQPEGYHQKGENSDDDAPEDDAAGAEDVSEYADEPCHSCIVSLLFRL